MSTTACHPITLTRELEDFPIGNLPLRARHDLLRASWPQPGAHIHPHAWIDAEDAALFHDAEVKTLVDAEGGVLAWTGETPDLSAPRTAARSFFIRYPWDLLKANEQLVGGLLESRIEGDLHPSAVVEGLLHLAPGARILPGVYIEGNVIVGPGSKLGPNCYIRGNTSIGANCHVGQAVEIKNSILLDKASIGHLSYVGDSIIGEKVNFGAGTIVSNFRHDGKNHHSMVDGVLVDTGRRKFGAIIGDGVHTGIHTSIYCGRKLWPGTSTRPGDIIQKDKIAD